VAGHCFVSDMVRRVHPRSSRAGVLCFGRAVRTREDDDDNNNEPIWPTWDLGALFRGAGQEEMGVYRIPIIVYATAGRKRRPERGTPRDHI
jgi:hypothetical protein